ncbi:pilus assembly protein [Stenotrophomonas sp. CC120222-04]|uniref:pilus assembly protein n=1 Tax=Stenotrophomonas sp. CC120222-04 TaxID=1378088 RepID=UPI000B6EB70D|nr:PilC/PilY family type IV pilus protein [Stenotrophomonas sp. CC120222-04]SNT81653.1 type IV pilus assembly protein PilY1 [Stenotrophomonas sp. CC120222-04]
MNSERRFLRLRSSTWLRAGVGVAALAGLAALIIPLQAALGDYDIAQEPLYSKQSQPPLMMMVMSRDEQLFNKAYSDYSDLDEDGVLDTTYLDTFEYGGYFDSKLCYSYASDVFKASKAAAGANGHSCTTGLWSGNFLNWVTMSRLDVMRSVLYGGQRFTDTKEKTVLERAPIPSDLHAWVKVYSGTNLREFANVPGSSTTFSFCSATRSATGAPLMRVAAGALSEWASTASNQCDTGRASNADGYADIPRSATDYTVRVEVCDSGSSAVRESNCRKYSDGTTDRYKPAGLLQTYGESGRLRFGLISGSYANPRDGGVLRRNIGKLAGNSTTFCSAGDEINLSTGQFCYLNLVGNAKADDEGVINAISNFRLDKWNWSNNWTDCDRYGILNRAGTDGKLILDNPGAGSQKCSAWGNPLAEMYAEALRYIANSAATGAYGVTTGELSGLPKSISWADPYREPAKGGNSYCATCNILVLSSGLPSFDGDNIGTLPASIDAVAQTNAIGTAEGISGKSWMVGRNTATASNANNTHEDICEGRVLGSLSTARGICPDIPTMEGSYLMAGMAKGAASVDLRPGVQGKPSSYKVTATTYAVAMAENLPKFDIKIGDRVISLAPLCQANTSEGATSSSGNWRSCFLGSVGVGTKISTTNPVNTYGRRYEANGTSGSFSLVWEDSLWGNDHDNDVVSMLSYCVGAACDSNSGFNNICWRADAKRSVDAAAGGRLCNYTTTRDDDWIGTNLAGKVRDDEVLIRIENLSAYAGNAMLTGYTISGSNAKETVQRLALRRGNKNGSVLSSTADFPYSFAEWNRPIVIKYKAASGAAGQLESPLWYAAKYGVPAGKKWDSKKPGVPDNYFLARNPTKLKEALEAIFNSAAEGDAPVGGSGSGARISTNSFTVSSHYSVPSGTVDWTGDVIATQVDGQGADGAVLWKASSNIGSATRHIYMATSPTSTASDGTVTPVNATEFLATNLPGTDERAKLSALGFSDSIPAWFGKMTSTNLVNYLRGAAVSGLRSRTSPLGDIVNSTTEIVSKTDDFGYASWARQSTVKWKATLGTSYDSFLKAKRATSGPPTMIYVGANDGMVHGFNGSNGASGGTEELAFIPSAAMQHIAELANPKYGHRYYVDGPLASSDVYYGDAWNTVLVGTTGGGGSSKAPNAASVGNGSVFALNVTDPTAFGASSVLWEVSGKTESDLGFVLGKPAVVAVKGADANAAPRFVAIFGNGVNSTSGKAALFVVDIQTGKVLKRLSPAGAKYAARNGLINIATVALKNNDGITDTVYGGDMQGNIWKFDLSSTDPTDWNIALSGAPLFTATRNNSPQPIMSGIEISTGPGGGISLFFGTGQYFAADDNAVSSTSPVQSLYGIWDNLASAVGTRDNLVQQVITTGTSASGYQLRDVTRNAVNYGSARGWYVDLQAGSAVEGERFVGNPRVQNGIVFFTSYVPGTAICGSGGGVNWLYGLNLLTGGGQMSGLSPTIGGEALCTGNCGGVALTKKGDLSQGPPVKDTNIFVPKLTPCKPGDTGCTVDKMLQASQCTFVLRAAGADPLYMPRPCGRQSWRQIR